VAASAAGSGDAVRFRPLTPDRLAAELAGWINNCTLGHPRIGIDGAAEIGATELADAVGSKIRLLGRPVIRASTGWWWRPASLRLELGRTDVDMLLGGWVDTAAVRRELLQPLRSGGSGSYLRRLRDPRTDRSLRDERELAGDRDVLLLDGPFLLADALPLDAVVHLQVSPATLARSLPAERLWWTEAFERYLAGNRPAAAAAVVVAYDHPSAPAASGLG
jgi:hypothetical protein